MKALRFFHLTALFWCVEAALGMEETSYVSNCRDGATRERTLDARPPARSTFPDRG